MSKKIGMSFNEVRLLGRVIGNPTVANGWCTFTLRTLVPEPKQGGGWDEVGIDVPIMTSDQKRIEMVQKYVKDERQLYIAGYLKTWNVNGVAGFGVIAVNIKLGNKTMFDDSDNNSSETPNMPPLPN